MERIPRGSVGPMTLCGCACHVDESILCACTIDTCPVLNRLYLDARDDNGPKPFSLPTCDRCGGLNHTTRQHQIAFAEGPESEEDRPRGSHTVPVSVLERHRDELRAMAEDIRQDHQPIGSSLGIARQARADAYEDMVRRIERDIGEATR